MKLSAPILSIAALLSAAPASAQNFTFDQAMQIGSEAVRAASADSRPVSIVVVNAEGRTLLALRMDGTSFKNLDVAEQKAVTAAALGAPTSAIEQAVEGGKTSILSVPGLSAIGGGVPVMRGDKVIGGVGVSGGTPQQDEAAAKAAIATIDEGAAK